MKRQQVARLEETPVKPAKAARHGIDHARTGAGRTRRMARWQTALSAIAPIRNIWPWPWSAAGRDHLLFRGDHLDRRAGSEKRQRHAFRRHFQRRAQHPDFKSACPGRVAGQRVGNVETVLVKGAGHRNADCLMAEPPAVLKARHQAWRHDFQSRRHHRLRLAISKFPSPTIAASSSNSFLPIRRSVTLSPGVNRIGSSRPGRRFRPASGQPHAIGRIGNGIDDRQAGGGHHAPFALGTGFSRRGCSAPQQVAHIGLARREADHIDMVLRIQHRRDHLVLVEPRGSGDMPMSGANSGSKQPECANGPGAPHPSGGIDQWFQMRSAVPCQHQRVVMDQKRV